MFLKERIRRAKLTPLGESGKPTYNITASWMISRRVLKELNGSRFVMPEHSPAPCPASSQVHPTKPNRSIRLASVDLPDADQPQNMWTVGVLAVSLSRRGLNRNPPDLPRCRAEHALEGAVEGRFGLVAKVSGDS